MYRTNYAKPQASQVDFATLRKPPASPSTKFEQNTLLTSHSNAALVIVGAYSILYRSIQFHQNQFNELTFQPFPKIYQQYQHQKTFNDVLGIMKKKIKSIEHICQFLNNYPITALVIQCWVRQRVKVYLQQHPTIQTFGNQVQILNDLNLDIRGPLFDIVAVCFGLVVKIKYKDQSTDILQLNCDQQYGDSNSKYELYLQYQTQGIVSGNMHDRQKQSNATQLTIRSNDCGYLRRSKMAQGQEQVRSGADCKSVKKQRAGQNQIKRKGMGVTPKNQLTANPGYKNDPFSLGFLNANNISKIRDSRPK